MESVGLRLLVKDFVKCFEFYSSTLGLSVAWGDRDDEYASFKLKDKVVLSIFKKDLMDDFLDNKDVAYHTDNAVIVIGCESVDDEYQRLQKYDIPFLNKPKEVPSWGIRCVHFRDPDGNIIELTSPLEIDKWSDNLQKNAEKYNYIS